MPAEVALDAVAQVTGTKLVFNNYAAPPDTRAIGLASAFRYGRTRVLHGRRSAGRGRREVCDCERSGEPALAQALYLINDEDIHTRLADPQGRLPKLLAAIPDDRQLIEELYLTALSRRPSAAELEKLMAHIKRASSREAALQDAALDPVERARVLCSSARIPTHSDCHRWTAVGYDGHARSSEDHP